VCATFGIGIGSKKVVLITKNSEPFHCIYDSVNNKYKFNIPVEAAMKLSHKISLLFVGLVTLAAAQPASAAPVRFDGSYVGGGVTGGVLESGLANGKRTFGGDINARIALPNVPLSVRGNVKFANTNSAIVPTITYDQGISNKTNVYAGAGYSFVQNQGQTSPLGNRNSVVLNAGVESEVAKGLVVYGDAKYGLKAYNNGKGALAIGGGVGLKF
jgi:hypothetical protein